MPEPTESLDNLKNPEAYAIQQIGWDPFFQIGKPAKLYIPEQSVVGTYQDSKAAWNISGDIIRTSIEDLQFEFNKESGLVRYQYLLNSINYPDASSLFLPFKRDDESEERWGMAVSASHFIKTNADPQEERLWVFLKFESKQEAEDIGQVIWYVRTHIEFGHS